MRLNEIDINHEDLLIETIIHRSANNVFKLFAIIENDSRKFNINAHDLYNRDEINEFISIVKNISIDVRRNFNSTHQTPQLISYLLSYLSGL